MTGFSLLSAQLYSRKLIADAKKNEHSAQSGTKFQPHLMQTYKKKKVNKKDGEFRVSYKTSDSWVFVGLEQIKQLSWKGFKYYEYDILVDDMKSPQVVNTKDEVVSPTLKNNPDYNCPPNKALTEMVHNPYRYKSKGGKKYHWKKKMNGYKFKLDNEFKYKCSSFRGMTVAPESSWKKVKLGKCPRNHVLTGIADNGS